MSVSYFITEFFRAKNINEDFELLDVCSRFQYGLALMLCPMALDLLEISDMYLKADGKSFRFSGSRPDDRFFDAVTALSDADELELYLRYRYDFQPGMQHLDVGPFSTVQHFHEFSSSEFENMEYTVFVSTDVDPKPELYYFGSNSVLPLGKQAFTPISSLPDNSLWHFSQSPVDVFGITDEHPFFDQMRAACRRFKEILPDAFFLDAPNCLQFSAKGCAIHSGAQLSSLVAQLSSTFETCGFDEDIDISFSTYLLCGDPHITSCLHLEIYSGDNFSLSLLSI